MMTTTHLNRRQPGDGDDRTVKSEQRTYVYVCFLSCRSGDLLRVKEKFARHARVQSSHRSGKITIKIDGLFCGKNLSCKVCISVIEVAAH